MKPIKMILFNTVGFEIRWWGEEIDKIPLFQSQDEEARGVVIVINNQS